MELHGATALVTGVGIDNLGHHLVRQLIERGATRVYAAARRPENVHVDEAEIIRLDLTDAASIEGAARAAADVDILINNAATFAGDLNFIDADLDRVRRLFETNFYGTLRMVQAFTPILEHNGGGAILNVLSAAAWSHLDGVDVYGATKAAGWRMTESLRHELAPRGIQVSSLLFGMAATPTLRAYADAVAGPGVMDAMMTPPAEIARIALDGIEAGRSQILGDRLAVDARAALADDPEPVVITSPRVVAHGVS
ncbi:SDR family NAD(P)-dependent oxidoreductase [Microbacterium protaetiae]|uniref:SDR family NAD(P)-dependent oxidoreductase n=2 Tax=Microbacterium protaetiae TaxID=2509458 RepID=A0A4P6EJ95_9MICO|nr:SDR family NAD(P)-dependent oxidoreductase [Microbacterium protaetiae]